MSSSRIIDDGDITDVLSLLVNTDESHARAKAKVKYLDHKVKVVKAQQFLAHTEGTQQTKESKAISSAEYRVICKEYEEAVYESEILSAKRKHAELKIEIWRTEQANRRAGQV